MVDTIYPANAVSGAPSYSGRMLRQSGSAAFGGATSARPLGARTGVRPGTSVTTVTATATVWTCGPFAGVADAEPAAEAGAYTFAFDAAATGAVTAADATNPRVDIVYVQVDDPSESDGSTVPAATRKYLAGTAAASPVAPATPARSFVVARINVPVSGGGSPTVTWVAPYAVAAGGILPVWSLAERDALTVRAGLRVYRLDLNLTEVYNGSAWTGATASFTPVWVAGTQVALASGTAGRWTQVGKLVTYQFYVRCGTVNTTGTWTLSLPVAAAFVGQIPTLGTVGVNTAGGYNSAQAALISGGVTMRFLMPGSTNYLVTAPAVNNEIFGSITYEAV
ncbi:hypothetical protein E3T54_02960 [Cryobacterium sp. Sr8]|uniref:hypothetical protein n=1 Tax=Cryobacterium sp. Sr8 TaxID=1259203 RepID=UPI001069A567|nr:hypothetical protein [Cryobacterium sp. Sr8]TFD80717.1 hypothetical protein E3T54_02960 [Cryobacterium sp. Sr8]